MAIIQTTLRINENLYNKLKECKTEYKHETAVNVSLNQIICIAIKEFLEDNPTATLDLEVY